MNGVVYMAGNSVGDVFPCRTEEDRNACLQRGLAQELQGRVYSAVDEPHAVPGRTDSLV